MSLNKCLIVEYPNAYSPDNLPLQLQNSYYTFIDRKLVRLKISYRFLLELKWHYSILAFLLLLYQQQQTLNKSQIVNAVFQTYIHTALQQNLFIGILNQAAKTCIANSIRPNKNTNLIFKTR